MLNYCISSAKCKNIMILSEDNPTEFAEVMQRSKIAAYEAETTKKVVMDY